MSDVANLNTVASEIKADAQAERVNVTRDDTSHEITTINGHRVNYDYDRQQDTRVTGDWPEAANEHVRSLILDAIEEREERENKRANHRNLNRMLTLLGALLIGLAVVYTLTNGYLGHVGTVLAPYAFVITILMDSALALYGYVRHY